jgi:ribosome-binding protein aMBF1 (putative translation factor)
MSKDTVIVSRAEYESLLKQKEQNETLRDEDLMDAIRMRTVEREPESGDARREYFPAGFVDRMLAGDHPLRIWREFRGLTMEQLDEKSGVTQSYISEIETGKKPGSVAAMKALAGALGVAIDDLVP